MTHEKIRTSSARKTILSWPLTSLALPWPGLQQGLFRGFRLDVKFLPDRWQPLRTVFQAYLGE